ncbi:MAG: DegT/DnrJ/EryC1/StrS family aminotransferase [Ignavibacteria bacterium]|nr:DegT/DnrJ/EryC1/StrS family aminotransferase [Ignavibacteria bacterium]
MKIEFVDLKKQYLALKDQIDSSINSVINESAFIGGKYVNKFESEFAEKYEIKNCIGVANGTDAIYIVLRMLGIGLGDEVITTALSWISTSESISQTGAKPVFVDIDEYFLINADKIEEKITKKTKAIIPVHLYGQSCNMNKIKEIALKNNLFIIEDCAQAHFAEYERQKVGTFGAAATFSFYPGKNLGAYGDAGAIITNDDELALKCRMYANHGALKKHIHLMEGINSRLDGLQAAILSVKLPYILQWNAERFEKAELYNELLSEVKELNLPKIREGSKHIFHLYVIRTNKRDELKEYLNEKGVETAIHYPTALPNLQAYHYLNFVPNNFPMASGIQNEILSLPIYPELTTEEIYFIASTIKTFFKY